MGKLTFPIDDTFKSIVEHALNAPDMRNNYGEPNATPSIMLIKDQGAYLMSAGIPSQVKPDNSNCVLVYANETNMDTMNPEEAWDAGQAICGGDDFVEYLPVDSFKEAIDGGAKTFEITLTENELTIEAFK